MTDCITVNTQSSIRIDAGKLVIYVDPLDIQGEPHDANVIFITHEHSDHFSPDDIRKLFKKEDTFVIAPVGMEEKVEAAGVEKIFSLFMRPGNTTQIFGFDVETVPSYNTGKDFHKKEYGWLGYIITVNGVRYYITGDMDASKEAEQVKCDVCLIPVGGTYTFTAKEAADFVNKIKPKVAIPTHYGSIVGEKTDGETFAKAVAQGIEVVFKL